MNLINYFDNYFWNDFKLIPTTRPNKTIIENSEHFFVQKQILFFGGKEWASYNEDIALINNAKKEQFILTLFVISTVDYYIKNNIKLYNSVFQPYDPPKLGFCGYGPHFEHPKTILNKWFNNQEHYYEFLERKGEVKELFEFIISKYSQINLDDFKNIIISNTTNIPHEFNHPVFFKFLDAKSSNKWKEIVATILN